MGVGISKVANLLKSLDSESILKQVQHRIQNDTKRRVQSDPPKSLCRAGIRCHSEERSDEESLITNLLCYIYENVY